MLMKMALSFDGGCRQQGQRGGQAHQLPAILKSTAEQTGNQVLETGVLHAHTILQCARFTERWFRLELFETCFKFENASTTKSGAIC